ncbi:MAG: hypothetical protein H6981_01235 [Gammaproteobacteria bacterium]|nr:hypothetical protein [Gammaproteobacteria bacterium]MCP5135409.1 hypothetical protein [Gammaproteobacteria bacterium]
MKRQIRLSKRQSGYTIVEMTLVAIGLAIIIGGIVGAGIGVINQSENTVAQTQLGNRIPQGVSAYWAAAKTLSGVTAAGLSDSTDTAWGDTWSVSATGARTVTIAYPLTSADDADVDGPKLVLFLTDMFTTSPVSAASYNATTDTLSVTYTL